MNGVSSIFELSVAKHLLVLILSWKIFLTSSLLSSAFFICLPSLKDTLAS
jgi:hypothetical protein